MFDFKMEPISIDAKVHSVMKKSLWVFDFMPSERLSVSVLN